MTTRRKTTKELMLQDIVHKGIALADKPNLTKAEATELLTILENAKQLQSGLNADREYARVTGQLSQVIGVGPASDGETEDGFRIGAGRVGAKALAARIRPEAGAKDVIQAGSNLVAVTRDGETYIDPRKPKFLTDLIPTRPVGGNNVEYRRQAVRDNQANIVPDGQVKPTSVYTLTVEDAELHVIAHMSEYVKNRFIQDDSGLMSWLQAEMIHGYDLRVEADVIDSVLADPGVQVQSFVTDMFTSLRKAVTKLQLQYVDPSVLAISPEDAETLDLERDAEDRFYFSGPTSAGPSGDIWSASVVTNDAVPVGTAIVGDMTQAARRYINGTYTFDVDTLSHFDTNETRARLEGRSVTVLTRPFAVVVVDLGTGS